jgi:hypothetical protein
MMRVTRNALLSTRSVINRRSTRLRNWVRAVVLVAATLAASAPTLHALLHAFDSSVAERSERAHCLVCRIGFAAPLTVGAPELPAPPTEWRVAAVFQHAVPVRTAFRYTLQLPRGPPSQAQPITG